MSHEIFSKKLKARLTTDGFNVPGIQEEAAGGTVRSAYAVAHSWLDRHYPLRFLRASLYNHQRDGSVPAVSAAIDEILSPWRRTACTDFLPVITLKELSRRTDMHPRHIYHALINGTPRFQVGEQVFSVDMSSPSPLPKGRGDMRRWQRLHARKDAEFLGIKLNLVAGSKPGLSS